MLGIRTQVEIFFLLAHKTNVVTRQHTIRDISLFRFDLLWSMTTKYLQRYFKFVYLYYFPCFFTYKNKTKKSKNNARKNEKLNRISRDCNVASITSWLEIHLRGRKSSLDFQKLNGESWLYCRRENNVVNALIGHAKSTRLLCVPIHIRPK